VIRDGGGNRIGRPQIKIFYAGRKQRIVISEGSKDGRKKVLRLKKPTDSATNTSRSYRRLKLGEKREESPEIYYLSRGFKKSDHQGGMDQTKGKSREETGEGEGGAPREVPGTYKFWKKHRSGEKRQD